MSRKRQKKKKAEETTVTSDDFVATMDGGLDAETLPRCAAAAADTLVAGSAIFGADDIARTIASFRAAADAARQR